MQRSPVLALALALLLSSGCFSFHKRASFSETTARLEVKFETAEAARLFFAAFDNPAVRHSDWKMTMGLLVLVNVEVVLHEIEWYNHLVLRSDTDRDGVITEAEARSLLPSSLLPSMPPESAPSEIGE